MNLTADTQILIPLGVLCAVVASLVVATWRVANALRDNSEKMRNLTEELRGTWSFRDQERWALALERENRSRGHALYVPDVRRAPDPDSPSF